MYFSKLMFSIERRKYTLNRCMLLRHKTNISIVWSIFLLLIVLVNGKVKVDYLRNLYLEKQFLQKEIYIYIYIA